MAERWDAPDLPDFSILKRLAKDQLVYILEQLPGKKDLFIEADLMSPLDRIANVSILKIVNADKAIGRLRKYKIIFSPQKVSGKNVTIDEWAFYLLPLDDDIISMELPEFFRDYFLEGDHRWICTAAKALHVLHSLFGPFTRTYGIGRCAKMTHQVWKQIVEDTDEMKQCRAEIGRAFFIDRDVDYVTPMCSQVVYEGLMDDIFRIKCGSVEFGPDVTSSDKSVKVLLNSQDKVFKEIRDEHFSNVFGFLSQKAKKLQKQYDKRQGMDIKQMKDFVSQELKGLKQEHRLLSLHIGACESIMKRKTKQDFQELLKSEHGLLEGFEIRESISCTEEHINRQISPIESLRLICLLSLTENGESEIFKHFRNTCQTFLMSYGCSHILTFNNLKRIGLLTEQQPGETLTAVESTMGKLVTDKTVGKLTDAFSSLARKSHFRALSKKLNLIPRIEEEYDLRVPRDMAYIFGGAYIPMGCRIIEQVLEHDSWTGLEDVTRLLNGNEFISTEGSSDTSASSSAQRLILLFFLGGCTFSEIAALRFLGKEKGWKFVFVTTAITNSARMLESMLETSS
uniref:VPS33B late endosome and lysosome associated n=1 Tax=Callorhinchus milii TaxID=7868 RepID=A0A4W3HZ19_CALMI